MTTQDAVRQALLDGRFLDASRLLREVYRPTVADSIAALVTSYYLGNGARTKVEGERLLEIQSLTPSQGSICNAILASQLSDDGEFETALELCHKSVALAREANDFTILCLATSQLLERTCDQSAFHASLPLAAQTRRYAVRCGDSRVAAAVHWSFGRLEARAGHFDTARRHFTLGRELLQAAPNLWLSAAIDLDDSSVLSLEGDFVAALALADRAAKVSKESGWSKGVVAAAANSAFLLTSLDRIEEAELQLRVASEQLFKSPSYSVALAETRAQLAIRAGDYVAAERILVEHEAHSTAIGPWYELAAQDTRTRILLRQQRWREAISRIECCLALAKSSGTEPFVATFQMSHAEALLGLGRDVAPEELPLDADHSSWPVIQLGVFWLLLAKIWAARGQHSYARVLTDRAGRVFQAMGSSSWAKEARSVQGSARARVEACQLKESPAPDLETAIALLDVAGYPHILGREAFAALDEAQCAQALALVAGGTQPTRVIETRGWDPRQALAAARKPEGLELIPIGQHHDETWQIVVQPRPELEHRCTLVAIRKLVATGAALDRYRREEKQRAALWPAEALDSDTESIWASEQMAEVLNIARRIAPTPLSILLTGETGTGKEMLARTIHRASDRADRAFLPFNCTAVPHDMLESQLFGYRKGAFTGADASFQGVIRSAIGGTLFLDEIAEVGLDLQPKLLRFLETHEIHPLGEPQPLKVDVRVIAATNANLEQLVSQGRFREDLFYRLNVVRLKLPPLRDRREEIPPLVQHYLRRFGDEQRKGRLTLSDETLEYLLLYSWPGNVRQLANEVRRMVVMAEADSTLTPSLLSPEIQASRRTVPATAPAEPEIRVRLDQPLPAAVQILEQTMVRSALDRSQGRVEQAARLLGISRKGLFLKRRRWGLSQRQAS